MLRGEGGVPYGATGAGGSLRTLVQRVVMIGSTSIQVESDT